MRRNTFLFRLFILYLSLSLLVFPAGCWDRREPSLLGIVTAVAYDYDPQMNQVQVIAQVANPLGISGGESGGGGGSSQESPFWVVEAGGRTIYEAVKKTEQLSTRKLIWSHLEVVLFSETLAQKGLRPILDYIDRERQARLIAFPFVVQGDVRQLLQARFPLEQLSGPGLIRQLATIRMEDAIVPEIDSLRRLFHHLSMPGVELILPRLEVQVEKKEAGGGEEGDSKEKSGGGGGGAGEAKTGKPNPAKISGAALFRGDKLVGFFDEDETAGYSWLTKNVRRLTMVFTSPEEENKYLTAEVFETATKLEPQVQGEQVRLRFSLRTEGKLQDFSGLKVPVDEDFKESMNRRMAAVIHNQINMAWQKARELNLDVFGFGNALYHTKPSDWKRLENKWAEIFPKIELEADVQANISSYGLVVDPIHIH